MAAIVVLSWWHRPWLIPSCGGPSHRIDHAKLLVGLAALKLTLLVAVPGEAFAGPRSPTGHVPQYVDNGFRCFFCTLAALAAVVR